jgi:diadenosine tetraphosphate (Ap4A) HIT family hydrolase
MSDAQSCQFCSLPSTQIVAEHPLALAFRDRSPLSKGHSLVIPRRHVFSFFDCTAEERAAMLALLDDIRTSSTANMLPTATTSDSTTELPPGRRSCMRICT